MSESTSRMISRRESLCGWRQGGPVILPSLLLCDFADLKGEIRRLEAAGARGLHLDVMDGHFVPNLTYGLPIVQSIRSTTRLPLDVHLMMTAPGPYIERFYQAGADVITIHIEASKDPRPELEHIRSLGAAAGLAINPPTPVSAIVDYLPWCDVVLVMSVMPGFGGQPFNEMALDKLRDLRGRLGDETFLEVDGGVDSETVGLCTQAGARLLVAGSAIFRAEDYAARMAELANRAQSA